MESTYALLTEKIFRKHTIHCLSEDLREEGRGREREGGREGGGYIHRRVLKRGEGKEGGCRKVHRKVS